jgi:hypothetical protein
MNQQARCPLAAQAGSLCSVEQLEEVSSMDNLLKILERAGNDLLQADEYLARVGVRAIPTPPKE